MYSVELYGRVRRACHVDGMSNSAAARLFVGLAAKPEIDILVIVSDVDHLKHWQAKLLDLGYKRGSDLMKGHYFFNVSMSV